MRTKTPIPSPHYDDAGHLASRPHPLMPGAWVAAYAAPLAGIPANGEPYVAVCHAHGETWPEGSKRAARIALELPATWCPACQEMLRAQEIAR